MKILSLLAQVLHSVDRSRASVRVDPVNTNLIMMGGTEFTTRKDCFRGTVHARCALAYRFYTVMAEAPTHSPEAMKFNASGIAVRALVNGILKAHHQQMGIMAVNNNSRSLTEALFTRPQGNGI